MIKLGLIFILVLLFSSSVYAQKETTGYDPFVNNDYQVTWDCGVGFTPLVPYVIDIMYSDGTGLYGADATDCYLYNSSDGLIFSSTLSTTGGLLFCNPDKPVYPIKTYFATVDGNGGSFNCMYDASTSVFPMSTSYTNYLYTIEDVTGSTATYLDYPEGVEYFDITLTSVSNQTNNYNNNISDSNYHGVRYELLYPIRLLQVNVSAYTDATKCYIWDENLSVIDTQPVENSICYFDIYLDGDIYSIMTGQDGASYDTTYTSATGSFNDSYINWLGGYDAENVTYFYDITSLFFIPNITIPEEPPEPYVPEYVAIYEMDEASGQILDASGNNQHSTAFFGTPNYHSATLPYLNYSIYFDGINEYFSIPDNDSFDFGISNFSAGGWFYSDASSYRCALGSDSYAGGSTYTGFFVQRSNTNVYTFATRDIDGGDTDTDASKYCQSTIYIPQNTWVKVDMVRENNVLKIYINGTFDTSCAEDTPTNVSNSVPFTIGTFGSAGCSSWGGFIDQVYVSNYALNDSQILERYNEHLGLPFGNFTIPITPVIVLDYPNEHFINDVNVTFNFTLINATNYDFYINGSLNFSGVGNYSHSENISFLEGDYNYFIVANNTDFGTYEISDTYNFSVLYNYSYCEVLFPQESYLNQNGSLTFNFTVVNSTYWQFEINDLINETNTTNGNFSLNRTLPSGYYNWSVFCRNDYFVNNFTSSLRNFTVFIPVPSGNVTVNINIPDFDFEIPISKSEVIEAEILKRNLNIFEALFFRIRVFVGLERL